MGWPRPENLTRLARIAVLAFAVPAAAAQAERITVTLDQAYAIGRTAFQQQNYPLAYSVATGLLEADPDNLPALTLLAASAPHVGKATEGRQAARKAYAQSPTKAKKREAALFGAVAAAKEERGLLTQLWLRRAYQQSDNAQQRKAIGQQYRQYARASRVKLAFSASVAPSSNLNGGAESGFLTIDGVVPIGVLSGSAQALSGTRATVRGQLTYTLAEAPTRKTTLSLNASASQVRLSGEAQALAPNARNSDFAESQVSARLTHQIAHQGRPVPDTYSLTVGQTWFGGNRASTYASASLGRQFKLGENTVLTSGLDYTHQTFEDTQADRNVTGLRLGVVHRTASADIWRVGLRWSDTASDSANSDFATKSLSLGYERGKPLGPATLSATLRYSETEYDSFRVGFIAVPGGRSDDSVEAQLNMAFQDVSYLGFVPQLNVNHIRTKSNISRFERKTTGLGLSFVSAF